MDILKDKEKIFLIEKAIGYSFSDKKLLLSAFLHPSFVNEYKEKKLQDNERLEFLGDSVFNLIISEYLYKKFPKKKEGELSSMRSFIVDGSSCSFFVKKKGLDRFILLGRGESLIKRGKETILADLFEAIIGAIYLDGGMAHCKKFVEEFYEEIDKMIKNPPKNYKKNLQEYFQKKYQRLPLYKVVKEEGPDHSKIFEVEVLFDGKVLGKGMGGSKALAQQNAAKNALKKIGR